MSAVEAAVAHGRSWTSALPLLIVTALPEELKSLRRIASSDVVTACTGDGPLNAAREASSILRSNRFSALVGVGVAGSLSPELKTGDLIVGSEIHDRSGLAPSPDAALLERAVRTGARKGTLVTVTAPLVSSKGKTALSERLGGNVVAAADMESAAWARAAAEAGVPYVIVRAISDGFEEDLPFYLAECVDESGAIDRGRVAGRALARPGSLIHLLRMRRRVRSCAGQLAAFVEKLLAEP